jgi:hypothetical protein
MEKENPPGGGFSLIKAGRNSQAAAWVGIL